MTLRNANIKLFSIGCKKQISTKKEVDRARMMEGEGETER
jgi:hypothetical protein